MCQNLCTFLLPRGTHSADANEIWICLIKLSTLYTHSPNCSLYISEDTVGEDLLDDPRLLSGWGCQIILFILITLMFV